MCSVSVIIFAENMEEITEIMHIAPEVQVQTLVRDRHLELMIKCTSEGKAVRDPSEVTKKTFFHKDGYQIIFRAKNRFCSDEHRNIFMRSLEWDDDGGKIMLQKDADAVEKVESFENVQAALRKRQWWL